MAQLFSTQAITKSFGHRALFTDINFGVDDGERLGLIGPNGAGKSTLLRILAGLDTPDSGQVAKRRGVRFGYVAQQDAFPEGATVMTVLVGALADQPMDDIERETYAAIMMGHVGFDEPDQPVAALSGGWSKRLSIAAALIKEPDVLLMDEPTNHLDLEGILWLEDLLKTSSFACVVVSHDRYFLEHVTNRVIELSRSYPQGFFAASGAYSEFLVKREEFLAAQAHQEIALANQVKREIEWLRRGPPARTTKAKYRIDEAGRMIQDLSEIRERNADERGAKVDFSASGRRTKDLLIAKGISKSYGEKLLFENLDLVLVPGERLGLLGPNGSGKSSLIKVLTGAGEPDSGAIKTADRLNVVTFEQNRATLDKKLSLRQALAGDNETVMFQGSNMHITAWAKRFLFRPEQLDTSVSRLSGGEQARVLIARLMLIPADLLVLDEPTNDLDIPTLELLEESLTSFPGALILVTHDRFMLDRVSTEILALDGTGHAGFYADYAQWESVTKGGTRYPGSAAAKTALPSAPSSYIAPKNPLAATNSAPGGIRLSKQEQRELDRIEEKIASAEAELGDLQEKMASPSVATDYVKLQDYMAKVSAQEKAVATIYARWEELEAKRNG